MMEYIIICYKFYYTKINVLLIFLLWKIGTLYKSFRTFTKSTNPWNISGCIDAINVSNIDSEYFLIKLVLNYGDTSQ